MELFLDFLYSCKYDKNGTNIFLKLCIVPNVKVYQKMAVSKRIENHRLISQNGQINVKLAFSFLNLVNHLWIGADGGNKRNPLNSDQLKKISNNIVFFRCKWSIDNSRILSNILPRFSKPWQSPTYCLVISIIKIWDLHR